MDQAQKFSSFKYFLISGCFYLLMSSGLSAQKTNFCGQAEVMDNWFKQHPEDKTSFNAIQNQLTSQVQNKSMQTTTLVPTYTIPVVFHILHTGGIENISDAQVKDAIQVMNRSYQKLNGDTINVVPSYTNNIANVQFEFRLAGIDPNGNCTNGIIRHYDPKTVWDANDMSGFVYTWPRSKYLNIYIVKSINIAPAYSFLPGTNIPASADCIVCEHSICGSIGTSNGLNAWALTHEAAHWFSIPHIWGLTNQPGVACGDDGISDTPITKGFTTCNLANTQICTAPIIENIQNYMDYSPCKLMFTNGQKAKMHSCITSTLNGRNVLSSSANLLATGVTTSVANCIPQVQILAIPSPTLCLGRSLVINSFTSNATPATYSWTASNGASIANSAVQNTTLTFNSIGNSTITCVASNSNGAASASVVVTVMDNSPQLLATNQESFETGALPPYWSVISTSTPTAFWNVTNVAASHGTWSMFLNAENAPGGSVEILQTPSYDFQNNPGSAFTFRYAYALLNTAHKDIFKVQASKDCGGTWKDIYIPGMSSFAAASGGILASPFVPLPQEWKTYNITNHPNFVPFLNEPNVRFRFYFQEDANGFGNRIYLDQINFESPVGINEFTKSISLSLHPNPSSSAFSLSFTLSGEKTMKLKIFNATGSTVWESVEQPYSAGPHELKLNTLNNLSAGIYFVETNFSGVRSIQKVIIV